MTKYNKYLLSIIGLIGVVVAGLLFLTVTSSYFNTKEINLLTSGCTEAGGASTLEIHNNLTSEYSFECKK
ncbi:hypothetical protein [uncultured Psychrobacillus sp.]|uniref:hypothetical protein n=1 Tax=uncultured Psychrobacillus sp. TaxID=1551585 RepID=UPI00260B34C5|nr:hypothetical protein [uncultured Psychrobacillus sp.]